MAKKMKNARLDTSKATLTADELGEMGAQLAEMTKQRDSMEASALNLNKKLIKADRQVARLHDLVTRHSTRSADLLKQSNELYDANQIAEADALSLNGQIKILEHILKEERSEYDRMKMMYEDASKSMRAAHDEIGSLAYDKKRLADALVEWAVKEVSRDV